MRGAQRHEGRDGHEQHGGSPGRGRQEGGGAFRRAAFCGQRRPPLAVPRLSLTLNRIYSYDPSIWPVYIANMSMGIIIWDTLMAISYRYGKYGKYMGSLYGHFYEARI